MLAPWPIGDKRTCRSDLCNNAGMKYPRRWKGTKLHVQQGRFGEHDIELPSDVRDFIFKCARLAGGYYSQISEWQQTKIRRSYERDLDRAARSETLRAMHHDVLMFGTDAFRATQSAIQDSTKKNPAVAQKPEQSDTTHRLLEWPVFDRTVTVIPPTP